ncbi:MAG TPA: hypothetical protein VMS65_12225 [Polyangiaceae bacterium]|nr:hypothetical protein [Polyangiaceae bacterium]
MNLRLRLASLVAAGSSLVVLYGCSTCDAGSIDRAVAFIDAHQSCETTADCVIVGDMCREIPGGFCGQIPMNREGAESDAWRALKQDVDDCAEDSCDQCLAGLEPSCFNGSCGGRM